MALSDALKSRVNQFAAAAATAAVAGAATGEAEASIHVFDVNEVVSLSNSVELVAIDTGFQIEFFANGSSTYASQCFWGRLGNLSFINYDSGNDPARWGNNVLIGPGAQNGNESEGGYADHSWEAATSSKTVDHSLVYTYYNDPDYSYYQWAFKGTKGFLGIRFSLNNDFYYGWVEILRNDDPGYMGITIERWALEDEANTPVTTPSQISAVPEPTSLGIWALAGGAAGLRSMRRRRRSTKA